MINFKIFLVIMKLLTIKSVFVLIIALEELGTVIGNSMDTMEMLRYEQCSVRWLISGTKTE